MLKIADGFLILDTKVTSATKKKMSGHSFVGLAGIDKYNKRGDILLQLLKYYKNNVDPKYLYRGDMAEKMVRFILEKQGKEYITYDEEYKKKNNYDCFPMYQYCGGIPDFELPNEKTIIEVKSKSLEKYDEVMKDMPIEEIKQGLFYTYLRNYNKLIMAYVFFDEESENLLFENKLPKTLDKCKVVFKKFDLDKDELRNDIGNALTFYNICLDNKAIPLEDISPKILQVLRKNGLLDTNGL